MSKETQKWRRYEAEKWKIRSKKLKPGEYEQKIKDLAAKLKL